MKLVTSFYYGSYKSVAIALLLFISACTKTVNQPQREDSSPDASDGRTKDLSTARSTPLHEGETPVFTGGQEGYHTYYAPSIVCTKNGVLVAICEGRPNANGDYSGNANIVCKRSLDGGSSWVSYQEVIGSGHGMWGNPTAVYDPNYGTKGRIWVAVTYTDETITAQSQIGPGEKPVYIYFNDNEAAPGSGWTRLTSVAQSDIVPSGTTADFTGPGVGIIQQKGTHAGRIIIPAKDRNIYSDDNGATWHYAVMPSTTNEPTIVEMDDGSLLRNDRAKGGPNGTWDQYPYRMIRRSDVNGVFSGASVDYNLPDPKCEGSILRYSYTNSSGPGSIIFLNSASSTGGDRYKMTVRSSTDGGYTWQHSRRLYDNLTDAQAATQGKGGYSSMCRTTDYAIGILCTTASNPGSPGSSSNHYSIVFHKVNLPWINQ